MMAQRSASVFGGADTFHCYMPKTTTWCITVDLLHAVVCF